MIASGKFIVLEGTDGSGKTVQFERLILALPETTKIGTLDFPQYNEPSSYFVQKYLTGKYGADVGPYTASVLFAMDRFDARLKTLQWLAEGRLVVANRYVASNMAHHGARISNKAERERFYQWLYHLEYETFAVPKPDLNIVLHVPAKIAAKLATKRNGERMGGVTGADNGNGKAEEEAYSEIAALFPEDFEVIECAEDGVILPMEKIHDNVMAAVRKTLGTP